MRAYHRSKSRPFATRPIAVQRLPINLMRTAIYPGRPGVVGNAIEAWQHYMAGAPEPTLLPQRLAFQQWKTNPNAFNRPWWGSAQSVMALSQEYHRQSGVPTRVATRVAASGPHPPTFTHAQAGMRYGGAYPGAGSARIGEQPQPVLLRQLPPQPTFDILAGQTNVAAPFPRPDLFIQTHQANAARAVFQKIQRRNAAEAGARLAVVERRGVVR